MLRARIRDDGFTLIELLIVVSILGILVAMATATYVFAVSNSRTITCRSNQRTFNTAVTMYTTEYGHSPDDIDDLEPYVKDFDHAILCPADHSVRLEWDADAQKVVCEQHPDE